MSLSDQQGKLVTPDHLDQQATRVAKVILAALDRRVLPA